MLQSDELIVCKQEMTSRREANVMDSSFLLVLQYLTSTKLSRKQNDASAWVSKVRISGQPHIYVRIFATAAHIKSAMPFEGQRTRISITRREAGK